MQKHLIIILLSLACLLTGCHNNGTAPLSHGKRSDSASIYQDMAYRAMFADSLTQAETYAYRSLMPEVYMTVMDVQMQIEQQKADQQQQYYTLAIILLLFLSGGIALWYLHRMKSLRELYQQRITLARQLLGDHGDYNNPQVELERDLDIAETKLGFDVLYAIINDHNISQMGKREEQALLKVLPLVDTKLCTILAKASSPLTPKETFFCLMEYYGKSDHQKALSFCCSDQAIRSTKSRLNKKLDIEQLR